ncbi:MAG: serine/threonine protein kinase [Herminiimonas sp.]|nr:serine/threonine protein kinase [Herminiimonas sp.]
MREPTLDRQNDIVSNLADPGNAGSDNCLAIGTRVADFEITGVIGEGGFGIVYLALDHSLQRLVAIKEYMPGAMAGRDADKQVVVRSARHVDTFATGLKSFINEARLLAQFDHPGLIKVYRFWEENKTGYMAMRYYEGQTLKSVITHTPHRISEAWLKAMLKPMLEALDALYKVQILHRDISPDNIMIQENGEAVLLDFGAARQVIGDITHALTVILKPGYAPIEQYADDVSMKQGPWTDIYSLCAVVYYAVAGKPPTRSVARLMQDPIELLTNGEYPGYTRQFLSAIDRGLAVKPQDRPQSIEEFRKLLHLELSVPQPLQTIQPLATSGAAEHVHNERSDSRPAAPKLAKAAPATAPAPIAITASVGHGPQPRHWAALAAIVVVISAVGYLATSRNSATEVEPIVAASVVATALPLLPVVVAPLAGGKTAVVEQMVSDEMVGWETLIEKKNATEEDFASYIRAFPNGEYTRLARTRMDESKSRAATIAAETSAVKMAGDVAGAIGTGTEVKLVKPTGTVRFTIKPWGTIMVDGVNKGVTPPLKKLVLPEGRHQITVINPNFEPHVVEIDIKKQGVRVDYDFSRSK